MNLTKQANRFVLFLFVTLCVLANFPGFWILMGRLSLFSQDLLNCFTLLILPMILFFLVTKKNVPKTLRLKALSWKNVVLSVLSGFAILPVITLASCVSTLFFPNVLVEYFDTIYTLNPVALFIVLAVTPAISEELCFRGIILSGYQRLGARKAIFYSALLFAMYHGNMMQASYTLLAGLFFGILAQYTGSVWSSIIAHFVLNGFNASLFFLPALDSAIYNLTLQETALIALLSLPVLGVLYYLLRKHNPVPVPAIETEAPEKPERFFTLSIPFIFILFIYIVLITS